MVENFIPPFTGNFDTSLQKGSIKFNDSFGGKFLLFHEISFEKNLEFIFIFLI
jgi:hypothetical protein